MVQSVGGIEDCPWPRWSKSIMLHPREMNIGATEDQREVFVRSEFANMSQGRVADDGIVRVTACRVRDVAVYDSVLGIGTVCCIIFD